MTDRVANYRGRLLGDSAPKALGARLLQICAGAFSFEMAMALFIFSNKYKEDPRLTWIPGDLTLLCLLLSVGTGGWIVFSRHLRLYKPALPITFGILLFVTWMTVTLAWSSSRHYGPDKATELGVLCLWAGVAPALIIAQDRTRFRRFTVAMMSLTGLMGLDAVLNYIHTGLAYTDTQSYLSLGRMAGFATVMALAQVATQSRFRTALWLSGLLLLYAFVLMTTGGRGPLIATLIPICVLSIGIVRLGGGQLRTRVAATILLLCTVAAVAVVWTGPENRTFSRLNILFTAQSGGHSAGERLRFYGEAVEIYSTAPIFGHGIGSWPVEKGLPDARDYPHNIFLEVLVEGGLIGLLLFVTAIAIGFRQLMHGRLFDDPVKLTVLLVFMNTFVNAQFSGDLSDNRLVFFSIGLMAAAPLTGTRAWNSSYPAPALPSG